MSYCRWSTDDFQCDLYCYESVNGGFYTTVAFSRPTFQEPLPEQVDYIIGQDNTAWFDRHHKVLEMVDKATPVAIGGLYDGKEFVNETLEEFLETLLLLRAAGYNFPDYVLENVSNEIAEADTP